MNGPRIGALALALAAAVVGCPLEVFEEPGCRLERVSCDDGNPCTEDSCDESNGQCVFEPVPTGTDCGDGDACNGLERCAADGQCEGEPPVEVDDGDDCTRDSCDPATGIVSHNPIDGCGETFWTPLPESGAPTARLRHTAVWTGTEMIIWGGRGDDGPTNTGARYNPQSNTWVAVSTEGAPSPRHSHSAVWTGNEMIIWGGFGESDYETTGARYDPDEDTWTPMTNTGAPVGRTLHSTIWTDTEMIVWGGLNGVTARSDGARYAVGADTWTPMPTPSPQARFKHGAVWTGSKMIIFGGSNTFDWLNNGAVYDRITDAWVSTTNLDGAPHVRENMSAVWTAEHLMLIWGGWDGGNYLNDGFLYDLETNSWTPINPNGPAGRSEHVSLWTGDKLVVWGGCNGEGCQNLLNEGGRFDTDDNTWVFIGADPGLTVRARATMVFTGTELIIWGGEDTSGPLASGGRATID